MATKVLLIRHGDNDFLGRALAGRLPSVHLNESGRSQAETLAQNLSSLEISAIYASPLERAHETAEPLATRSGLQVQTAPEVNEVEFGGWNGWPFSKLNELPEWHRYNRLRSQSRPPGGETMQEITSRMVMFIESLGESYPNTTVAVFGHADPIKFALMSYLGVPVDFIHRFELDPASVSCVEVGEDMPRVLFINRTVEMTSGL